jgi:hypothetical protein
MFYGIWENSTHCPVSCVLCHMNPSTIVNVRYGLRRLLQNSEYHSSESAIPKESLTPEREPAIRDQIKALATAILRNPSILLIDSYTELERRKDWQALQKKQVLEDGDIVELDTRSRPGHKILDHHMPHFYRVANYKGVSVESALTQESLEKALMANLAMHSTPYKSEIRRMLILTAGLSNVTKYRTVTAKAIVEYFGAQKILDPCVGWGGRMLGTLVTGGEYVGCEPDPNTAAGLRGIISDPALPTSAPECVRIFEAPVEECWDRIGDGFDMILTSPPYYNLELYTAGEQCVQKYPAWEDWVERWLKPVIIGCLERVRAGGVSCWSVKNIRTDRVYPLADEVARIHREVGWELVKTVTMRGSARPGGGRIQAGKETRESEEETFCFQRRV